MLTEQLKDKIPLDTEKVTPDHLSKLQKFTLTVEIAGSVCVPTAIQQVVPTEALSICLAVPGMNPRAHSVPQAMRSLHGVLQK